MSLEEAAGAIPCSFALPTCALHNLYPLSEEMRRLLTDEHTASMECLVLTKERSNTSPQRNLRSSDSTTELLKGNPSVVEVGQYMHSSVESAEDVCRLWKPFNLELTRTEYEENCSALFSRGVAPVTRLLEELDLRVDEIDEVVMVGGMTRTPRVREILKSHLGVDRLNVEIDPDVVVAYGATTIAH